MKNIALSLIGALAAFGVPGGAFAQRASLKGSPIWSDPVKDAQPPEDEPFPYPTLQVKVGTEAVGLKASDFSFKTTEGDKGVTIGATKMVAFRDSNEPMFMAILVQGTSRFMGVQVEGEDQKPGYYDMVKQAVDVIAKARPKNTQVAVWVYHAKADRKVDFSAPEAVNSEAIGALTEFADKGTKGLNVGIQAALTELSQKQGRKILVIIGDGGDQDERWKLANVRSRLESESIECYFLGAGPDASDNRNMNNIKSCESLGSAKTALQREQVPQLAEALANDMNNVYTVEFPGFQLSDHARMPFDGSEHEFVVVAKKDDTAPRTMSFPLLKTWCGESPPWVNCVCRNEDKSSPHPQQGCKKSGLPWGLILGIAGGVLLLVVIIILVTRKKGGAVEEEEIVEAPPQPVAPAAPAAPARTMALNIGGGDDSMPVVGWIVPTSGPSAWQTFKLTSRTVIGTAPDAQVNVGDAYQSGHHAEILMNQNGFIIMDRGSSNGIIVNSKRVTQHELVDNDVFTCGKTDFKFKSIN